MEAPHPQSIFYTKPRWNPLNFVAFSNSKGRHLTDIGPTSRCNVSTYQAKGAHRQLHCFQVALAQDTPQGSILKIECQMKWLRSASHWQPQQSDSLRPATQQAAGLQLAPWQYPPSLQRWTYGDVKMRLIQQNFHGWYLNQLPNISFNYQQKKTTKVATDGTNLAISSRVDSGIRPLLHRHPRLHPAKQWWWQQELICSSIPRTVRDWEWLIYTQTQTVSYPILLSHSTQPNPPPNPTNAGGPSLGSRPWQPFGWISAMRQSDLHENFA